MTQWPSEKAYWKRARSLLYDSSKAQKRAFIEEWLARWEAQDPDVADLFRCVHASLLESILIPRALAGHYNVLRLLEPSKSTAMRSMLEQLREKAHQETKHLEAKEQEQPKSTRPTEADPLSGNDAKQLLALIRHKDTKTGLAVRAVHDLVSHGEKSIETLAKLCLDPRAQVRSAALRALKRVASKIKTMEVSTQVLEMETRKDVLVQLMRSLGHARHLPALPLIIKQLSHRERRLRQGAYQAIRACGSQAIPALHQAIRRTRPDRQSHIAALLEELTQKPEDS